MPPAGNRRLAFGLIAVSAALGTAYRAAEWARPGMPWTSLLPVLVFGAVAGAAIAALLYAPLSSVSVNGKVKSMMKADASGGTTLAKLV